MIPVFIATKKSITKMKMEGWYSSEKVINVQSFEG